MKQEHGCCVGWPGFAIEDIDAPDIDGVVGNRSSARLQILRRCARCKASENGRENKAGRAVHIGVPSQRLFPASAPRTQFVSSSVKLVSPAAMCPVSRAVTSWSSQPLPSGSLNEAYEA